MEMLVIQQKNQRLPAMILIMAVLFQLYITSTATLNPSQVHNGNWLTQMQSENILLCTADGFKWVNINTLIKANNQPSSDFVQNLNLHQSLHFECPLLKALQFFLLIAIGAYLTTIHWLRRITPAFTPYRFAKCDKLLYMHLAPKQSPPDGFPS